MTVFLRGHHFGYELQRVAQMFFFGEKVEIADGEPEAGQPDGYLFAELDGGELRVSGCPCGDKHYRLLDTVQPEDRQNDVEHKFGVMIYRILSDATGIRPPWGVLTGIRPVKLFASRMRRGEDDGALRAHFTGGCLMSEERFSLAMQTAKAQKELLCRSTPDSFSLYVSIPFCPTRCAYCSFVSHSVEKAAKLLPVYVDRLCEELRYTAEIASSLGLSLRTVYFGGGTPTTLLPEQLSRICETISACFDTKNVWEYTVEAGRPDTITRKKLEVIRAAGADRISINPQTLSDSVLGAIGRKHTTRQTLEAFALARSCGCDNINMDLIAGLPTDTPEGFRASVDGILALAPENITVHTLTVKRSAEMTFERARAELAMVGDMVDYARNAVQAAGYRPYYLYRQNGSLSALENVGYAKPGTEGFYNVYIMDETHSIFAVGAGASTKLCHPVTGEIKRIYNYKYPYEYVDRFETVKERKLEIPRFYGYDKKKIPETCL
ncbi:coproporphyrinogen dehydrogenase HemZ [Marasmitruncus massiliensis]|uniref:coproporphyrinogen dehydrogenase HemZ n=1 Tax=Marasmitruncus massiliensis TaxID=1944642 RepID=UPI000C7D8EC6|nr:coproporphyrinogen dehydrogenase HemZ [Marasmitruncus massiliensis]